MTKRGAGARGGKGAAKARARSEAKKKAGAAPRGLRAPEMEVISEKLGEPIVQDFLASGEPPETEVVEIDEAGTVRAAGKQPTAEVVDMAAHRPVADTSGEAGGRGSEFHQEMECALTDAETARKSAELAAVVGRHRELLDEKREYVNRVNGDLKGLVAQSEELAVQVRTRRELRPVKCRRVQDSEHFKVAVFRTDTNECVDVRDMTQQEAERIRQQQVRALGPDVVAAILAWRPSARAEVGAAGEVAAGAAAPSAAKAAGTVIAPPHGDFSLRDIPGVGEKAATALTEHGFGTIQSLRDAVTADLKAVPGIGEALAQKILLYVETNFPAPPAPPARSREAREAEDEEPAGPRGALAAAQAASHLRAAAAEDGEAAEEVEEGEVEEGEVEEHVPVPLDDDQESADPGDDPWL
jgi:hypothetical protein